MMAFELTLLMVIGVGALTGAVASIAGFGIGSLLTPLFAIQSGTKLAVAAVSIPHAIGTGLRLWMMREHVDRRVLFNFGATSAAGGLLGALLHQQVEGPVLTAVFGILLVFAGLAGLSGLAERMRFSGLLAWIAGAVSGFLGGLVGNQGGIRSAAMLGIDVPKEAFVATATAIALIVDVARVPVYLMTQGGDVLNLWFLVTAATAGVVIGTLIGAPVLRRVPERIFRAVVSAIVLILGGAMLFSLTQ